MKTQKKVIEEYTRRSKGLLWGDQATARHLKALSKISSATNGFYIIESLVNWVL